MTRSHPPRQHQLDAFAALQAVLSAPYERDRDPIRHHFFVEPDGSSEVVTTDGKHWAKWARVGGIIFSKNAPAPFRELAKRVRANNG